MQRHQIHERLVDSGVVGILRGIETDDVVPVARALYEGGVTALEITADTNDYSDQIAAVRAELGDTDAVIGAGTVMDTATARSVIDAGAQFVLSPHLDAEVVDACNRAGVLAIPGIMTPTEAVQAMEAGADCLKLFPASTVGPSYVRALRGPLGDVPIIPTGGVTPDTAGAYFDAGAIAVGAGSALVDYDAIAVGDMDGVRERAADFVSAVEDARSG